MQAFWSIATWLALFVFDVLASVHAVLHKRDNRAAIGWVGLIWLTPGAGGILYLLFGLNRIRRQASEMQRQMRASPVETESLKAFIAPPPRPRLAGLAGLGGRLTRRPVLTGNTITPLENGDEAYPAMLAAIEGATGSVTMCSYIFAVDAVGTRFVDALARAVARGVEVRVLVDDVGMRYTRPPVRRALKRAGVPAAVFLPIVSRTGIAFFNLRTHRKLLVVDGETAFAGGMNIHGDNVHASRPRRPIRDVHFRIRGPVVHQLQDAFAEDWAFATGERLHGAPWYSAPRSVGEAQMRVITGGPDDDFERTRHVLLGAIASARRSVGIVTPYFLPDAAMISALAVSALRGVQVDIVIPERGNVALAQWAATAQLWQVLKPGCRVHLSPAPFDHTKLFCVDEGWTMIGTTNWDPRSLRLNFELDVECYDEAFASWAHSAIAQRVASSRPYTLHDADSRSAATRVRDGIARLAQPYL